MTATESDVLQSYTFKASPWSSHSQILNLLPERGEGRMLLDVGCWDGLLAARLAGRGYIVTGLERQSFPEDQFPASVKLLVADLHHEIPPITDRYDYIVCGDVLEHLLEHAHILRQLRLLLKPDGCLVASLPNSGNLYFRLVILSGNFPQDEKGLFDRTHVHFHTWAGWAQLFGNAGYTMVLVNSTPIPFSVVWGADSWLAAKMESLFWGLARLWKSLFGYQFIVMAKSANE
jgi:SAM-dependent methyltransferase